jgi:23S rRNA pseudouridine1911/1915/1917 synthase
MIRTFVVDRGDARQRLDRVLARRLPNEPGFSRARLQRWIRDGCVRADGVPARRPSRRLTEGERLEVQLPVAVRRVHLAEDIPLTVIYEDDDLCVVDKPAGLVVHPTRRYPAGTLVNALLWHEGSRDGRGPRLVHRLDKDTSGLLIVARHRAVHAALARAMTRGAVTKMYLAVVYGTPRSVRDRIDLRIERDPETGRLVASRHQGRPCSTLYQVIDESTGTRRGLSLLQCTLVTGRLHQIRVHLHAIGCPLVGDPAYGEPRWRGIGDSALADVARAFPRQALHAWRLTFTHPVTGVPIELTAPVPADLQSLLDAARLRGRDVGPLW